MNTKKLSKKYLLKKALYFYCLTTVFSICLLSQGNICWYFNDLLYVSWAIKEQYMKEFIDSQRPWHYVLMFWRQRFEFCDPQISTAAAMLLYRSLFLEQANWTFVSHSSDFFPCNSEFISHKSDFVFHDSDKKWI